MSRNRSVILTPAALLALAVALLCTALQFLGFETVLRFDRAAIASGSWWLLLTGNFVHFGPGHLLMNLLGLALIYSLVWDNFNIWQWLLIIVTASIGVGVGLYLFDTDIHWYVGFSGTLHGLIIAGTLADFKRFPGQAALLLVVVVAKLAWEQWAGSLPGSESLAGGSVAVNSHLFGAITGAVVGGLILLWERIFSPRTQTPT